MFLVSPIPRTTTRFTQVALPRPDVDVLMDAARRGQRLRVDLPAQTVAVVGDAAADFAFDIDPFRKRCLLEGLDDIALTMQSADAILDFEATRSRAFPWLDGAANAAAPEITVLDAAAETRRRAATTSSQPRAQQTAR